MALFVEGMTELNFAERLIREIAGRQHVDIHKQRIIGGSTCPKTYVELEAAMPNSASTHYILMVDCQGDNQVKTRIIEEHSNLTKKGYECILGLRDVRPDFSRAEIPRLERGMRYGIRTNLAPVDFILAIMEIEAWFLAEETHLLNVHASLTPERIEADLLFNPRTHDMALRDSPTDDLIACYALVGVPYQKGGAAVVPLLNMENLYMNTAAKVPYLQRLISAIEDFLALPALETAA